MSAPDTTALRMQYIGAIALLGRVQRQLDDESRECAARAIEDCVTLFPDRLRVVQTTHGPTIEVIT